VDGDYLRILGRKSEIINVGGEKVYPAEVEAALLTMPNVAEVSVTGEPSPFTGNSVTARFNLREPEEPAVFPPEGARLLPGQAGAVQDADEDSHRARNQYSERFKKMRRAGEPGS